MAIKERKQITGTTAQINAYEGHEGQIIWDKEKKTLVGMSGTAGKNYPLAPKEYVDNEVAKVNTQLTEGLEGKEDKGTCLPLTGGVMSGGIQFNNAAGIAQSTQGRYEELLIYSHDQANNWQGGMLSCRGHGGSLEEERGSFVLGARRKDGSGGNYLLGTTAGNLLWLGNEIMRVTAAGDGWIRSNPNIQICFGSGITNSTGFSAITFGAPFSGMRSLILTPAGDETAEGSTITTYAENVNETKFNIRTVHNGVLSGPVGFFWLAIGYY